MITVQQSINIITIQIIPDQNKLVQYCIYTLYKSWHQAYSLLQFPSYPQQPIYIMYQPRLSSTQNKNPTFKPIYLIVRCVLNCMIYYNVFKDPGFTDQMCGPLAVPVAPQLFNRVIYFEIAYLLWPVLIAFFCRKGSNKMYRIGDFNTLKFLFLLIFLKYPIIFAKSHRYMYFVSVALIELIIFVVTGLVDLLQQPKLAQAWEIIITDSFIRIATFYEITRTFCPNFAIYFFLVNLLVLCMSQIEAHLRYYYPKSNAMDPVYPGSLYVKQDIYRLMILTFVYFGAFGFLQASRYGYGVLVTFFISAWPFLIAINYMNKGQFRKSLAALFIVCLAVFGLLWSRVNYPELFKPLESLMLSNKCGIFDNRQ